jgi:hypothetical protein
VVRLCCELPWSAEDFEVLRENSHRKDRAAPRAAGWAAVPIIVLDQTRLRNFSKFGGLRVGNFLSPGGAVMGESEAKRRTRTGARGRAANVTFPRNQRLFFILRESNQETFLTKLEQQLAFLTEPADHGRSWLRKAPPRFFQIFGTKHKTKAKKPFTRFSHKTRQRTAYGGLGSKECRLVCGVWCPPPFPPFPLCFALPYPVP